MDGSTSLSSVFELDQSHTHNYEAGGNCGTDVGYSHASKYDQQNDQHNQSLPQVDYSTQTTSSDKTQHDQSLPQAPDHQLQPEAPQPSPAQSAVQYQVQGNRPVYPARPAGPGQFPPQSPQINLMFQNGPNPPTYFLPQSPQFQHVPVHNVQMTQPVHLSKVHYQRANPVYPNEAHQPAPAYQHGRQTRSIHPPGADQNMGPQAAGVSPHQAGYQGTPSPMTFPPDNGGVPLGFGAMPGYTNAAAQGYPVQNQGQVPVIVVQQPQVATEGWKTGLFDCMDDPNNALITAFFPCVTFGQIAEIINQGQTSCSTSGMFYGLITIFIAMPCIMSCTYRTKLRNKYRLVETPAPDWVTHFFCEWCALCQEYRELRHRGIDPSIGWQGNIAKAQQQVDMLPPVNQRMMA